MKLSPLEGLASAEPAKSVLVGMGMISLGAMVVEISLTRVFSLLLYYHYTFLVVGLAMLGLALGGLLVWLWTRQAGFDLDLPGRWGVVSGVTTGASAVLIVLTPPEYNFVSYLLLAALPFLMVGATTSATLARFPTSPGRVYGADLAGAASGALVSIPVLGQIGGINALLASAAIMGWGGWLLWIGGARPKAAIPLVVALALSAGALVNSATSVLDVDVRAIDVGKTMAEQLRVDGRVVYTGWDAFARTDVVALERSPDLMYLYIDGSAASAMYRFKGDTTGGALLSDVGFFPFRDRSAGEVLAIGPGGGKDVLLALLGGASRVTAVEVNPGTVEAVRRFSDFNGGLYDRPDVEVVVDEGRAYLRRSHRRYDTIYLSLAMTQAAERMGYAMAENYLYTVEAMGDYLAHLKPGGQLVFKVHDRLDLERVIRTSLRALEGIGISRDQAPWYLQAVSKPDLHGHAGGGSMYPVLILRREPFTEDTAMEALTDALRAGFLPLYWPGYGGAAELGALGTGVDLSRSPDLPDGVDLSPTTDDRPFFYLFTSGPPAISVSLVAVTLAMAAAAWLGLRRTVRGDKLPLRSSLAYFSCLGFAFMMVEVVLLQKLTLFLGHPTFAVTTVLLSLLLSGAVGSWLSGRLPGARYAALAAAVAGVLAIAYAAAMHQLTSPFLSSPPLVRALVAGVLISPLGILMGIPLPAGLRRLVEDAHVPVAPLAWAANGFASVLGSASAIIIASSFGFTVSMVAGGAVYLAAALLAAVPVASASRAVRDVVPERPIRDSAAVVAAGEMT